MMLTQDISSNHESASQVLNFYRNNGIIPVNQDVSDIDRHFEKRETLYRQLGIVPLLIRGKRLIEFGPGTGHNALFMMSLGPSAYTLVDGNEYSVQQIYRNFDNAGFNRNDFTVETSLITDYPIGDSYDVVLCEGVTNIQKKPSELVQHVSRFVRPGGVLVITTVDSISYMSETLRRLLARLIVSKSASIEDQLKQLTPVFKLHLDNLKGMSRLYEDWLLDNIISPDIGGFYAIDQCIELLEGTFDFYNSSPKYISDYRWFKEVDGNYNGHAKETFLSLMHNHIDYRYVNPARAAEANLTLRDHCEQLFRKVEQYNHDHDDDVLLNINEILDEICGNLSGTLDQTVTSIREFMSMLQQFLSTGRVDRLSEFLPFFGRGQQYISFIKKK